MTKSSTSRVSKRLNGTKPQRLQTIDELLFGSAAAPSEECLDERRKLLSEFRAAMVFMRAPTAAACLDQLKKHWATWDGKQPSRFCSMIQNIGALRSVEGEMRKPRADGAS